MKTWSPVFISFVFVACATKGPQTHKDTNLSPPAEAPGPATPSDEKISISKDTPVVHNDEDVVRKLGRLCPFTLIEMAHEKIVRIDCDGTFAERQESDLIKVKKRVKFPARGTWNVKDNEIVFSWEGQPARGYTIDVMKGTLFLDGVEIKAKNQTYKIDAPD